MTAPNTIDPLLSAHMLSVIVSAGEPVNRAHMAFVFMEHGDSVVDRMIDDMIEAGIIAESPGGLIYMKYEEGA